MVRIIRPDLHYAAWADIVRGAEFNCESKAFWPGICDASWLSAIYMHIEELPDDLELADRHLQAGAPMQVA